MSSINLAVFVLGVLQVTLIYLVVHLRSCHFGWLLVLSFSCRLPWLLSHSLWLSLLCVSSFGSLKGLHAFRLGRSCNRFHACACCIIVLGSWFSNSFGLDGLFLLLFLEHLAAKNLEDELSDCRSTLELVKYLSRFSVTKLKLCRWRYK